ncbi:Imm10 family immunity protein [Streptomyces tirandamycinicus]|uniref:Imm10 family immunity protein n=1 Tax=Streptomyces tirandamycinicus TaxID=2174846 RepID=UPI00226F4097|nr:Imm10 family immunity protein [Streptomyces tirandamycinicus]MCY0981786.1 Imm10 family immunity protein [Streptomyces tirandamycinicus]
MSFTVRRAGVEHYPLDEDDAFSVGVDDGDTTGAGRSILFMCMEEEEDEDLERYCLSMETGLSHYGGVERLELRRDRLTIDLDEDAVDTLRLETNRLDLPLEIPEDSFEELRSGLYRVFGYGREDRPELIGF